MKRIGLIIVFIALSLRSAGVDLLLAAASETELQPLLDRLENKQIEKHAVWTCWTGTIDGRSLALALTEGDPLNSVAVTTLAIRSYQPKLIMTFGSARAHDPSLKPGDVVVSEKFAAFDGIFSPAQQLGAGSNALAWHKLAHPLMSPGELENYLETFPADRAAVSVALKLKGQRGRVGSGVLGSANQINREADRIAWLRTQWGTSCEDGESAHVAGCALLLGVPVVGLRVIDGREGEAAALVLQFLKLYP